jgi:hypothetical protein
MTITEYLLNPADQTIRAVQRHFDDWKAIAPLIGAGLFTTAYFTARGDLVYVDDEGLLKKPEWFFSIAGYRQPLSGKGLISAVRADGNSVSARLTIEEAARSILIFRHIGGGEFVGFGNPRVVNDAMAE